MQKNPIAAYKEQEGLSVTELAEKLGTSKGHACDLVHGKERVGIRTAHRMAALTGRPWWDFMPPPKERARA